MNIIKVMLKHALLFLILIGLVACDDNDVGEVLTYADIGTNFSGDLSGAINEDEPQVTGTVMVTGPDGNLSLQAQSDVALTYGSFSITSAGQWTYVLDNTNPDVQALNEGATLTDGVGVVTVGQNTEDVSITITGVNDDAVLGGVDTATITSVTTAETTGSLTLTDVDANPDTFIAQTDSEGSYGSFSISEAGAWTYLLDINNSDVLALTSTSDPLNDVIAVSSEDGLTATITITINGVDNTPAVFSGDLTGSVDAGDTAAVTGTVTVTDSDPGEGTVVAQTNAAQDFGSFSIGVDGTWSYILDNSNTMVQELLIGETLTEDIAITSDDDTVASVVITINGTLAAPTGTNNVAEIIDTMGSANGNDTGELRYALGSDGPLAAGRLEAKVKRLDDSLGDGDAFITLFNSNTNNAGAILDLRIRDSSFGVRDSAADADASANLSVVLDTFMDVVITWEYPGGDTNVAPQVTVEVDGASIGPFTTTNSPFGGVTHVAFRFGDNGGMRPDTGIFSVDDLAIYSDTAGTTEVFSDDFESYSDGDSLDTDNPASPYNSSTSEATVAVE